jgi:hypothetical protein
MDRMYIRTPQMNGCFCAVSLWLVAGSAGLWLATASAGRADTELSKTLDCSDIQAEAVVDPAKSRDENLARLSEQFFQSVNTIDHCERTPPEDDGAELSQDSNTAQNSEGNATDPSESADASSDADDTSGDSADAASTDTDNADNGADGASGTRQATASSSLTGTNIDTAPAASAAASAASDLVGTTPSPASDPNSAMAGSATPAAATPGGDQPGTSGSAAVSSDAAQPATKLTNGKIPDDIPEADNDSVFEAQIRAAALAEPDPEIQKNLWNEYRRYTGLPEKD